MFRHKSSFLWGRCPAGQLLGCIVSVCLVFLRNCQPIFQNDCTILHRHVSCMKDPVFPHPCQQAGCQYFIFAVLIGVQYLIEILMCFSLFANDVECFHVLFAICISSSAISLPVFCPFFNWMVYLIKFFTVVF